PPRSPAWGACPPCRRSRARRAASPSTSPWWAAASPASRPPRSCAPRACASPSPTTASRWGARSPARRGVRPSSSPRARWWAAAPARRLGDAGRLPRVDPADLVDVRGTGGVRSITVRRDGKLAVHPVVVVAFALPGAPAYELPAQAGAEVRFDAALGYTVITD